MVGGKEQYCIEVSNRFAALEDLDTEVEISSAWETIRENIKISAKESLRYFFISMSSNYIYTSFSRSNNADPSGTITHRCSS
jgi:hypothetical protein